ncbi:MAG: CBS domain-containing protein [Candidatus Omnitrophota bacterium]
MKAQEIMTKEVVSLRQEDNVLDGLSLLFKMKISGLPVVDANARLVGMFTEKDVLSRLLPSYIEKVGKFIYEENPKSTKKKFADLSQVTVSQIMRKEIVSTKPETTLCEVARLMLTQKTRRVPVIDETGKMLGIIARCDILKALAREAELELKQS